MVHEKVNILLAELLVLEAQVKEKSKRIAEIKAWCKEAGTFSTDEYVCSVMVAQRIGMAGLAECEKVLGRRFLYDNGLIKHSDVTRIQVSQKRLVEVPADGQD